MEKYADRRAEKLNSERAGIIKYLFNYIMVFHPSIKFDIHITDAHIYLDTFDNALNVCQAPLTIIYIDDEGKLCYKLANNGRGYVWSIDTDILRRIYKFYRKNITKYL